MSRLPAMDAASSSGASSDSEMNDAMPLEAPEVDEATFAARRAEILASVTSRNGHIASLLSLIPKEHFQHHSEDEEVGARQPNGAIKSKKARKMAAAKAEKSLKQVRGEMKEERRARKAAAAASTTAKDDVKGKGKEVEETNAVVVEEAPAMMQEDDGEEAPRPSLSDLRVKLDNRIKALQAARAPTREGLLADRREKRARREERKREERKEARKAARRDTSAVVSTPAAVVPPPPPPPPTAETSLALAEAKAPATSTLTFGHLDFAPADAVRAVDSTERKRKRERPSMSSGDPSVALAAIENRKKFLSTHSVEARERAEDRDRWTAMAARAGGEKVYDDETKLKKAIKKREKVKERSKDKWAERYKNVEDAQAARQQLRTANLAKRKEEAKGGKKKSGKARPGFEGGRPAKTKSSRPPSSSKGPSSQRKGKPFAKPT